MMSMNNIGDVLVQGIKQLNIEKITYNNCDDARVL